MKNRTLAVLACIALVLAAVSTAGMVCLLCVQPHLTPAYTLYIGLEDKDQGIILHDDEEAMAIVDSVCSRYFGGYTLFLADGRWTDGSGNLVRERTIVCQVTGKGEKENVQQAVRELLTALNQGSILVDIPPVFAFESLS